MNFTKDDILKIKQALDKYGVKDTEFQYADTPISTKDIVTIVQDGKNKKIYAKEFVNELMNVFGEAFINLTDRYGVYIDSLKDAIFQIPSRQRKEGLLITFLDNKKHWKLYQFQGSINQFNNPNLWVDLFNVESYAINSLLADEEDLTATERDNNGNSKIKLKDRSYDPNSFSGMGYKILRKNIREFVNVDGTSNIINYLDPNELLDSNTVYEIRYDFDLNNQRLILPDNSILYFSGGNLKNGEIFISRLHKYGVIKGDIPIFKNIKVKLQTADNGNWDNTNVFINVTITDFGKIETYNDTKWLHLTPLWNNLINFFSNIMLNTRCRINVIIPGGRWVISERMFIPTSFNIDFNNSELLLDYIDNLEPAILLNVDKDTFMTGYQKELNGEEVLEKNMYVKYGWGTAGIPPVFKNLKIIKNTNIDGTQVIFAHSFNLENINISISGKNIIAIRTYDNVRKDNSLNFYEDGLTFNNIILTNDFGKTSEDVAKIILHKGDSRYLNHIIGGKIVCIHTDGIKIENCINTRFRFEGSKATLDNIHNEFCEEIEIYRSDVCISNSTLYYKDYNTAEKNIKQLIYIADTDPDYNTNYFSSLVGETTNLTLIKVCIQLYSLFYVASEDKLIYYDIYSYNGAQANIKSINCSSVFYSGTLRCNIPITYIGERTQIEQKMFIVNNGQYPREILIPVKNSVHTSINFKTNEDGKVESFTIAKLVNRDISLISSYSNPLKTTYYGDDNTNYVINYTFGNGNNLELVLYIINPENKDKVYRRIKPATVDIFATQSNKSLSGRLIYSIPRLRVPGVIDVEDIDINITDINKTVCPYNGYYNNSKFFQYVESSYIYYPNEDLYKIICATEEVFTSFYNIVDKFKEGDSLVYNNKQFIKQDGIFKSFESDLGDTENRPKYPHNGFQYYDTTLNKKILWNGTEWVNLDGSSLNNIGPTINRPTTALTIGFMYYDVTLGKIIMWNGSKWINLDGTDAPTPSS